MHFYPRSPCGERRINSSAPVMATSFLSTLSLRRATLYPMRAFEPIGISIHALLAESDLSTVANLRGFNIISIHALLAESDAAFRQVVSPKLYFYPRSPCGERLGANDHIRIRKNFYPRSPCGERRCSCTAHSRQSQISIHALLAESDYVRSNRPNFSRISIHALLAESDRALRQL